MRLGRYRNIVVRRISDQTSATVHLDNKRGQNTNLYVWCLLLRFWRWSSVL